MLEEPEPSVESEHGHEDGDPSPCPEDEEFFVRPDAVAMDEAIGKFSDGLDAVETVALADRNFNVPCESGIRYPSLTAMLNPLEMLWRP